MISRKNRPARYTITTKFDHNGKRGYHSVRLGRVKTIDSLLMLHAIDNTHTYRTDQLDSTSLTKFVHAGKRGYHSVYGCVLTTVSDVTMGGTMLQP